jgi:hypothetical protein
MRQAGILGYPCSSSGCQQTPKVWHASSGDTGATPSPLGKVTAAGIAPMPHAPPGSATVAPVHVAWSEHPVDPNLPKLVVTVACQDTLPTAAGWLKGASERPLNADASEIVSIDFGQGISKIAIAVDTTSSVAGQDAHNSQFGLLPGDACGSAVAVDWDFGGKLGLVQGRNPTTAFSNDGVLWRALARGSELRVLAPMSTR